MTTKAGADLYHSYCYKEKRTIVEVLEVTSLSCATALTAGTDNDARCVVKVNCRGLFDPRTRTLGR